MQSWRLHQREFDQVCLEMLAGRPVKKIILDCTPGGGKSMIPVILAGRLIPKLIDRICWVVPRLSLRRQGEIQFGDVLGQKLLGHTLQIRQAGNEENPSRDQAGYVTTYQAIGEGGISHLQEFRRHRYALVLDEPHHVELRSLWEQQLRPLVENCALLVLMSGTFERGDKKPIAFLPYRQVTDMLVLPDFTSSESSPVIRYKRPDALRDRAIVPLHFQHIDARVQWVDSTGQDHQIETFDDADKNGQALMAALSTGYAKQLLRRCAEDWRAHRDQINKRAKMLVIAPRIRLAQTYKKELEGMGLSRVAIATSDDSPSALAAIERFGSHGRDGIDVLVTVGMAYEGLDVKAITHVACLTQIRSKPWLEQALARAVRVDPDAGPWEQQVGHIWIPDDPMARQVIAEIRAEQEDFARLYSTGATGGTAGAQGDIVPLESEATRERASALGQDGVLNYVETRAAINAMQGAGILGVSPLQFKQAQDLYRKSLEADQPTRLGNPQAPPSKVEAGLRNSIEEHCRTYEARTGVTWGTLNKAIRTKFNKPRAGMTIDELRGVWVWVQDNYPLSVVNVG
jgi:superfamily II DNA or RNA helicase